MSRNPHRITVKVDPLLGEQGSILGSLGNSHYVQLDSGERLWINSKDLEVREVV